MIGNPLFVYGTLRDADVLDALLGRTLPAGQRIAAVAPQYAAVHYPGRVYPALMGAPHGAAPGLLLYGLSAMDLAVLDAFEGDEYCRGSIAVQTASGPVTAGVYLPVLDLTPDALPWALEQWTKLHKPAVLAGEQRTAQALRERLGDAGKTGD